MCILNKHIGIRTIHADMHAENPYKHVVIEIAFVKKKLQKTLIFKKIGLVSTVLRYVGLNFEW